MLGETLGSYRILHKLGEGGFGAVYVGEHVTIGQQAAVKVLLPELSRHSEIVQRFFNEARAATRIRHPGIVQVFDFGTRADGTAYLVMELLDGEPLAARLARLGRLPPAVAARIGRQIAAALGAAHDTGIVHRDLKPDNVFLIPDAEVVGGERIKVLDFGIAKLAVEPGGVARTRTGMVMGTPSYMSPEQCRGAGEVDARSDVYALGCILFELLAGQPPFVGAGAGEVIGSHQFVAPPSLRERVAELPPLLDELVARMLAKDPADRPQTMAETAATLEQLAPAPSSERAAVAAPAPTGERAAVTAPTPTGEQAAPAAPTPPTPSAPTPPTPSAPAAPTPPTPAAPSPAAPTPAAPTPAAADLPAHARPTMAADPSSRPPAPTRSRGRRRPVLIALGATAVVAAGAITVVAMRGGGGGGGGGASSGDARGSQAGLFDLGAGSAGIPLPMVDIDRSGAAITPPLPLAAPPAGAAEAGDGVAFQVLEPGTGESPTASDVVDVRLVAWRPTGETEYAIDESSPPAPMAMYDLTPAIRKVLSAVRVGGRVMVWTPVGLGGEEQPRVYLISLVAVRPLPAPPADLWPAPEAGRAADGTASRVVVAGRAGRGDPPARSHDLVRARYIAWDHDGQIVDATAGMFLPLVPYTLAPGLQAALTAMQPGETALHWIPSERLGRPPGDTLAYQIEVASVVRRPPPPPPPPDIAAPPADAQRTASGIPYRLMPGGAAGPHPAPGDRVAWHFTAWDSDGRLVNSTVIDGVPRTDPLASTAFAEAFQIMAPGDRLIAWIQLAAGRPGAVEVELVAIRGERRPITEPWGDNFERAQPGPDYYATAPAGFELVDGALHVAGPRNRPLWLERTLPADVQIDVTVWTTSPDADIKLELFAAGDGGAPLGMARDPTGYVVIMGGWANSRSVIGYRTETGKSVVSRVEPRVEPGRRYHWRIIHHGTTLTWYVDDLTTPFLEHRDEQAVDDPERRALGFSGWATDTYFDDLVVMPL